MFWRITGTDAAGKQATVYIQGTIHLGDDRLYPLSGSVLNAWNSADRNKAWVDKITSWISEGGTTFIFAECAHFVGNNSVFTYLKKTGML